MERQQATGTQTAQEVSVKLRSSVTKRVQFTDSREEYEPNSDCSCGGETLSGEPIHVWPGQVDLSGEFTLKRRRGKILSQKLRNLKNRSEGGNADSISSNDGSESQSWENVSETNSNSDVSEVAIHYLLIEWKQRGLDKEMHQDPDTDRYTSDEKSTVVDNAGDELELIALSKRPTRLRPYQSVTIRARRDTFEKDMVC